MTIRQGWWVIVLGILGLNSLPTACWWPLAAYSSISWYGGEGNAPVILKLMSGSRLFKRESYRIKFELDEYAARKIPLECKINGWYWGNLLFGGFLGLLVIDPATGAMYILETPEVLEMLTQKSTGSVDTERSLKIGTINDIPGNMKTQLVKDN